MEKRVNVIRVKAPRWSTQEVLIRSWALGPKNLIVITDVKDGNRRRYEHKLLTDREIAKYPTDLIRNREGKLKKFYAIPLSEFKKNESLPEQLELLR